MAIKLSDLPAPRGARHRRKRLGCGTSSGHGKTCGRGQKGQRARSGSAVRPEFEGGQMPIIRRLPNRGFNHEARLPLAIVNVNALNRFPSGSVVDPAALAKAGLIRSRRWGVKILGEGALTHPVSVKAHQFSSSALEKIAASGGSVERLPRPGRST